MSSTKTILDSNIFPTVSMPVTILLIAIFVSLIFVGFFALFYWRWLKDTLFSNNAVQGTMYGDFIDASLPSEKKGLDTIIIQSFPVFLNSSETTKDHGTECSICLSEFSDGDAIRLITDCRHAFHVSCIDLWFESHKTCPVCRCELDPDPIGFGSHESLHSAVIITTRDLNQADEHPLPPTTSPSKSLTEASTWRFWRSHSTGHAMVKTPDCNVKNKRRHYHTRSCLEETPPTCSSSKKVMEASDWRYLRSHSNEHFMVKREDVSLKIEGRHYQTGNNVAFEETPPTTSSSKIVMKAPKWRFQRSRSAGHCMFKTTDFNLMHV